MDLAKNHNGILISAEKAQKNKVYVCPNCSENVLLAGGMSQKYHFRHKRGSNYEACKLFVQGLNIRSSNNFKGLNLDHEMIVLKNNNLTENEDYTILSYTVEDLKRNYHPFHEFCGIDQDNIEIDGIDSLSAYMRKNNIKYRALLKNCFYFKIEEMIFKLKDLDVNINVAINNGFGVLKMKTGPYAGFNFMFNLGNDDTLIARLKKYHRETYL